MDKLLPVGWFGVLIRIVRALAINARMFIFWRGVQEGYYSISATLIDGLRDL